MNRWYLLAALLFVATVLLVGTEFWRRQSLYWYEVGKDQAANFTSSRTRTIPVAVKPNGFTVPDLEVDWDTAVLRLSISSTLTGFWFEPYLTVRHRGSISNQFIERGAEGNRHFVLPIIGLTQGDFVELTGTHLSWEEQTGELSVFRNTPLADKKILVIAPHPDDAEIAAFGLYSRYDCYIATVTAGNYVDGLYAHIYQDETNQEVLRGDVRTWDSIAVPMLGRIHPNRVVNLGYSNSSLAELHGNKDQEIHPDPRARNLFERYRRGAITDLAKNHAPEPSWRSLVADLSALVESVSPDIIVAPHPMLDAAPDHQFTTIALLEALADVNDRQSVLFLYTNHHVLSEYYPFGPSDAAVTLPPWFEPAVPFPSIYSHPLSNGDQVQKLFALEAMHDLRYAPQQFYGGPMNRFFSRMRWAIGQVVADPLGTYSYFRRAVRPNELFFVYEPEERAYLESLFAAK